MTTFTEGRHAAEFLMSEASSSRSRDNITIAKGSGLVAPGTVLGKVTATGKFVPATDAGATGAEIGLAINLYEADTSAADVTVSGITRDAEVNQHLISFDASVGNAEKRAAKYEELAEVGIIVR